MIYLIKDTIYHITWMQERTKTISTNDKKEMKWGWITEWMIDLTIE